MIERIIKKDALYERLKQDILLGHYKLGEQLPSEPLLAARLKAGRVTVRSALERLEKEKLVLRYQGKGTFVANRSGREQYAGKYLMIYFDSSDFSSSTLHIMPGIEQYCAKLNIQLTKIPLTLIRFAGYERALEIQPDYSRAMYGLGVLYTFEMNQPEKAVPLLENFLTIQTKDTSGMFVLARAYYMTGRYDAAVSTYDKIIETTKVEEQKKDAMENKELILASLYGEN